MGSNQGRSIVISLQRLLARWRTNSNFKKLSLSQQDAMLGILTAAILADGEVEEHELEELGEVVSMMEWQGDPRVLLDNAPIDALTDPARLSELGVALEQDWLREEAYYISARIVASDREIQPTERAFLEQLVASLQIPAARLRTITQKLLQETEF